MPGRPGGRERVGLRPARPADAPALAAILAHPEVARWWGRYDAERVRAELPGSFAIEIDGRLEGWLQCHEETDPDHLGVAFDIALSARCQGRGHGPQALRLAVRHFAARGHHRFTIDPAADNRRAIRAYEAVGFRAVGIMRRCERAADGSWRDGLLMDLLAADLHEAGDAVAPAEGPGGRAYTPSSPCGVE